jgi:DNA-binding NarL/FixJ family response regulator
MPGTQDPQLRLRVGLLDSDPIRVVGFAAEFERHARLEIFPLDLAGLVADLKITICIVGLHGNLNLNSTLTTLRGLRPGLRILLMGPEATDPDMLSFISAGAKGYLHETSTPDEIEQAIEAVRDGAVYVPKRVLSQFAEMEAAPVEVPPPAPDLHLTAREREVLQLLVAAQSNREIARALGIEERTVKAHIAKLMRKVGVDNRIALSVFAVRHAIFATSSHLGNR